MFARCAWVGGALAWREREAWRLLAKEERKESCPVGTRKKMENPATCVVSSRRAVIHTCPGVNTSASIKPAVWFLNIVGFMFYIH